MGTPFNFSEIKTLGKKDDQVARKLLDEAVSLVLPVMAKHKWKVGLLTEFQPGTAPRLFLFSSHNPKRLTCKATDNECLLGLNYNRGEKICVRLRPAQSPTRFCDPESILGAVNTCVCLLACMVTPRGCLPTNRNTVARACSHRAGSA